MTAKYSWIACCTFDESNELSQNQLIAGKHELIATQNYAKHSRPLTWLAFNVLIPMHGLELMTDPFKLHECCKKAHGS